MAKIIVERKDLADYLYSQLTSYGYAAEEKTVNHISYMVMKYLVGKGAVSNEDK